MNPPCYARTVNRARTVRRVARPLSRVSALLVALVVVGCGANTTPTTGPLGSGAPPSGLSTATNAPSVSDAPTVTPATEPTATPTDGGAGPSPSDVGIPCSGNDANVAFFAQAAVAMSWPVYCAVLPSGWFLESGSFRLANGGQLIATYRGPGDSHLAIAEGNICDDVADVEVCAPRDAVIGPAAMGDMTGALGRLANGLVLDVERGANPSWRVTGLGVSEAGFITISAAMLRVTAGG